MTLIRNQNILGESPPFVSKICVSRRNVTNFLSFYDFSAKRIYNNILRLKRERPILQVTHQSVGCLKLRGKRYHTERELGDDNAFVFVFL